MDNVIGYDALTMILRMMGYGAFDELTGTNYRANALDKASELGMAEGTDKNSVDYSKVATREEVFEYLYRAMLQPTFVKETSDALVYSEGPRPFDKERYEYFVPNTESDWVVTSVPAVDNNLKYVDSEGKAHYGIEYDCEDVYETAVEFGTKYLGHVVTEVYNNTGFYGDEYTGKTYGLTIESYELKLDKDYDLTKPEDLKEFDKLAKWADNAYGYEYEYYKNIGVVTEADEVELTAGTYYACKDEEGYVHLVTKVIEGDAYVIIPVELGTTEDGVRTLNDDFELTDENVKHISN